MLSVISVYSVLCKSRQSTQNHNWWTCTIFELIQRSFDNSYFLFVIYQCICVPRHDTTRRYTSENGLVIRGHIGWWNSSLEECLLLGVTCPARIPKYSPGRAAFQYNKSTYTYGIEISIYRALKSISVRKCVGEIHPYWLLLDRDPLGETWGVGAL